MPEIAVGGCRLVYDVEGRSDAPAVLLSHALGTHADLWSPQLGFLGQTFRVIRYDTRGHGRSGVSDGEYTIDQLGADALAILDAAGAARAHVCGLSLGGLTAMWLAVHAPDRIGRIVLASTAARIGTVETWTERIHQVRTLGMEPIADAAMARWFTAPFKDAHPDVVARHRAMVVSCPPDGYVGCCAVLRDADLREEIRRIRAAALVIAGSADPVTTVADGRAMCERIAGARMRILDAAHISNAEVPGAFNAAAFDFLANGVLEPSI